MTAVVNRFYVMLRCMTIFYASRNSNLLYNVTPNLKKIVNLQIKSFFLVSMYKNSKAQNASKGQLISKCPYEKSVLSKIPTKNFRDFCPSL